ncbi:hypothetical protein KTQ74_06365 [Pseudomonas chlororaphis]|uniref:hypothetical protein n=1 Tax=Pseudomonas chlororaphis TaxID=587753 RepID=UPI001E3F8146|nr:hypothetical protein [Pseudomonas chlororaphis]MCB2251511.1 hypothetical protein [Pseudomonas chlororaphis]
MPSDQILVNRGFAGSGKAAMPEKRQGISAKRQQSGNATIAASSVAAKSQA